MARRTPAAGRLDAWRRLLEAHAAVVDRLGDELERERGLPLAWYDVLVQLDEAPRRRLRMNRLADAVMLSRSGLTRLVDRMETAGLVERTDDEEDGRCTVAALTPAGRAALRRAAPVHVRGVAEHFSRHLSEGEARALSTALGRVAAAAREGRRP